MRTFLIGIVAFCISGCALASEAQEDQHPATEGQAASALNTGCNLSALRSDPSNGGIVSAAYCAVLDRPADLGGFNTQVMALNNGLSKTDLLVNMFNSAEEQAFAQTLSNVDFLTILMYRRLLLREPDADGLRVQLDALNTGTSRETIFRRFIASAEFHALWAVL